jgi:hypothetical protein
MALTTEQRWIATKIDTRMQKLIRAGKDNTAIITAMTDHMPSFHQLLSTLQPDDMQQLMRKFPGFCRYARILETLAAGIPSGASPMPGWEQQFRQTTPSIDHRLLAAAMDRRMRQLAEEGVRRSALIERMTGYVADLGKIWTSTTDAQLAALCAEYPGFHSYAVLMEEAAEAERQKPTRPYDVLPELPNALKQQLSSLLSIATELERDYHALFKAADTSVPVSLLRPLDKLHAEWEAGLTRFTAAVQDADLPQTSRDMILPVIERMAQQIGKLQARVQSL